MKNFLVTLLLIPAIAIGKPSSVTVYTQNNCEACHKLTSYLTKHNVSFKECNITTTPACTKTFESRGWFATPTTVVNGIVVYGDQGPRIERLAK